MKCYRCRDSHCTFMHSGVSQVTTVSILILQCSCWWFKSHVLIDVVILCWGEWILKLKENKAREYSLHIIKSQFLTQVNNNG